MGDGTLPSFFGTPDHWRARAKEARDMAGQIQDMDARRSMLEVAAHYEKIAIRSEARLAWPHTSAEQRPVTPREPPALSAAEHGGEYADTAPSIGAVPTGTRLRVPYRDGADSRCRAPAPFARHGSSLLAHPSRILVSPCFGAGDENLVRRSSRDRALRCGCQSHASEGNTALRARGFPSAPGREWTGRATSDEFGGLRAVMDGPA